MLKTNKHIDAIITRCVTDKTNRNYDVEVQAYEDFVSLKVVIPPKEGEHEGFHRFVVITAEDNRQFKVKFTEQSINPAFTTQEEERTFISRNEDQLAFACRIVYAHINGKVNQKLIPPVEYVAKWEEMNERWFKNTSFAPHLFLQGSEWGDDWRFKLVHANGTVIIESLDPATADGHTYLMACRAAQDAFDRGVIEGEVRAGEALTKNLFRAIVDNNGTPNYRYPQQINRIRDNGLVRPDQATI